MHRILTIPARSRNLLLTDKGYDVFNINHLELLIVDSYEVTVNVPKILSIRWYIPCQYIQSVHRHIFHYLGSNQNY